MYDRLFVKSKRALSFLLALAMLITQCPVLFGAIAAQTNFSIEEEDAPTHHKTIVDNGDGTFDINLDVHGVQSNDVNVVMVLDVSTSMQKSVSGQESTIRSDIVFDSVSNFVNELYQREGHDTGEINVSVVAFSGMAWLLQTWTGDKNSVLRAVDDAKNIANTGFVSGTNPQAGLNLAKLLYQKDQITAEDISYGSNGATSTVKTNRPTNMNTAENYVLFFSDGGPNRLYVNRDQIAITHEEGTTPPEGSFAYVNENGQVYTLTEIADVNGQLHAVYNGATYPIVTSQGEEGFFDDQGNWHKYQKINDYQNEKHTVNIRYPGSDGYENSEEFYSDYSYGTESITEAVISTPAIAIENGRVVTPLWEYNTLPIRDTITIVGPMDQDYVKVAAQAALVEVEDIYEYAQSRDINIDVMSFGVGGWFTDEDKDSKFPTAKRFIDLVAAVGNGKLSAYEAEEAYLMDGLVTNSMPFNSGDVDVADYTKVYASSNTADAYYITDRNYTSTPWVADSSATADVSDWIYLDLGGLYSIGKANIDWQHIPGDFELKVARVDPSDTSTWTGGDVTTSSNWTTVGSYNRAEADNQEIKFDAVVARYVLISSSQRVGDDVNGYNFGIKRINITRENANAGYDPNKNLALDLSAIVDWNASTDGKRYDGATDLVTDGDLSTIYYMDSGDTTALVDGISIDLQDTQNVNKVVIHWEYAPFSFAVLTSVGDFNNRADWQKRADVFTNEIIVYDDTENAQSNLSGTTTIEFDVCKARYIRIGSEARNIVNGTSNWAIREIEVFATKNEDAFALAPAYKIYDNGIAPLDSVSVDENGNMFVTPYYYINDAYEENRVYTAEKKALNSDVSFDEQEVLDIADAAALGGDSAASFDEHFEEMTGTILQGFMRVSIYDTFSKYVTLDHEIDGLEEKSGVYDIETMTTTYTNPSWLTVKSYTSTNNEDGKNTSDSFVDYKLDEDQLGTDYYTAYYHVIDDANGGEMPTEAIELTFRDNFVIENQTMIRMTVTVKPSQYAIDTYYRNITAEDYVASLAKFDVETGFSTVDENGDVYDGGLAPESSVYDRRTTNGYPDQAFKVLFKADSETGMSVYNTANPYYAGDENVISAQIRGREYLEDEYGFHTNVMAATNIEYYITSVNAINHVHAGKIMAASYDMPVIQVDLLDIPVKKIWNDGNIAHSADAIYATISWEHNVWDTTYDESGIASVYNEGTETKSVTVELNEANGWSGVFKNIPQGYTYTVTETYLDGTPVGSYTISMSKTYNASNDDISVSGHTFTISDTDVTDALLGDGLVITNTFTINKTITKVWEGDDEATRPMNVTVQLYADGVAYGSEVILSADNNWTYTWEGIPEFNSSGDKVNYYVNEVNMNEYAEYESDEYTITSRTYAWDYYMSDSVDVDIDWYTEGYVPTNTAWSNGSAPFSNWYVNTLWDTDYIWLRQSFNIADVSVIDGYDLYLDTWYDQPATYYINGVEVLTVSDGPMFNGRIKLSSEAKALLKSGINVIAISADFAANEDESGSLIEAALVAVKFKGTEASDDYHAETTQTQEIIPMGSDGWLYYASNSDDAVSNWAIPEFDSIGWPAASAPFGNIDGAATEVTSDYLWVRHSFNIETAEELEKLKNSELYLRAVLNENARIYINGRHVYTHTGAITTETMIPLGSLASEILVLGSANAIGIKLINTENIADGVYLDASLVAITDSTENGVITNVKGSEIQEFSVVSNWEDHNNVDGIRPEYVTVQLYADGVAVDTPVILSPANSWSYTWTELATGPIYTVVQSTADGYTTTYDYSVGNLGVILNVHDPETVDKTVVKVWDDANNQDSLRPEKIQVQLYANGKEYGTPVNLSGTEDTWSYTWSGLPKYVDGAEIVWSVQEINIPYGYAAIYSYDRWTITNRHTAGITTRTVTKVWEDNNNPARPSEVTVQLFANAQPLDAEETPLVATQSSWYSWVSDITMTEGHGGWNNVGFGNLGYGYYQAPFGDTDNSNTVWMHADADGDGIDDNYTIWIRKEFNIPDEATLNAIKKSDLVLRTIYDQNPVYYINGQEVYAPEGFVTDYTDVVLDSSAKDLLKVGDNCIAIKCTNDGNYYLDNRVIDAGLYYDTEYTVTLNAENNWTYSWGNLPLREDGIAIKYAVYEVNVPDGYKATYSSASNDTTRLYVTNTLTKDITVTKSWFDNDNAGMFRPENLEVQLFSNGNLYGEYVTLNAANNWTYTWTDVPYYENGEEIIFSVSEVVPNGYTPYYKKDGDNFIIENHVASVPKNFTVVKTWDDIQNVNGLRPDEILVQLYQGYNGVFSAYGRPVKLSAENGWRYSWSDLLSQISVDGTLYDITYRAEEIEVPDCYTVMYSHNSNSTEIVNTLHTQNIVIEKHDGFDPEIFLPGAEFVIELLEDDKITVDNHFVARRGVTDENGMLVFDNLTIGFYRITEVKAPYGYDLVEPFVIEITIKDHNIAIKSDAVASSTATDGLYGAEHIVDGDPASSWKGTSATDWFYVDFGVNRAIDSVFIQWENASDEWALEYLCDSEDPTSDSAVWKQIGTYSYNEHVNITDDGWKTGTSEIEFDTVVARYLRLRSISAGKGYMRIWEFEVYLDKLYEYAQDGFAYTSSVLTESDNDDDIFQYTYMDMASNVGDSLTHRDDNNNDDGMYYGIKEEDYTYSDIDPDTEGYQHPDEWIAVDLLENTTIDKITIHWENASNNFRIIYLEDGCAKDDWLDFSKYTIYTGSSKTTVVDDNGVESDLYTHDGGSFTIDDVKITDSFWLIGETIIYLDTPINARYIGIVSTDRACTEMAVRDTYYAIREIDMFNTNSANPEFDHALSKSAYAYNIKQREEHKGSAAIDMSSSNYLETAWISDVDVEEQMSSVEGGGNTGTQYQKSYRTQDYKEWINVKLDGTVGINHIVLEWADSNTEYDWGNGKALPWDTNKTTVTLTYPEEYYILYSLDGSYWTEFYHVTNADGGRDEYTFPEIQAKYIRVYIPDGVRNAGNGTAYALYSLELYSRGDQYVAVLDTPQSQNSEVVIDYGLPVQVDVMADQVESIRNITSLVGVGVYDSTLVYNTQSYNTGITDTEVTGKYGVLSLVNGKLVYTPTNMCFQDTDVFTYCLRTDSGEYRYSTITIIPATNILYEEDFETITYSNGTVLTQTVENTENLASGKPGYSLTESNSLAMTDGDISTVVESSIADYVTGTPEFFAVDLGQDTAINKLKIDWENCGTIFYVAYMGDGGDPTDVNAYKRLDTKYTYANDVVLDASNAYADFFGIGTTEIQLDKTVYARYVGVYVTERRNNIFCKIREMEIYNTATDNLFGSWYYVADSSASSKTMQDADRPGKGNADDADNAYGFDSAYDASTQFGLGTARKVTVSADNNPFLNEGASWPTATFTFTGTGFDIVSMTNNMTGTIWVDVYKGPSVNSTMYKSWLVDTYYGYSFNEETEKWEINNNASDSLYQIPVINAKDLDFGTYTVVITAAYSKGFDHNQGDGYQYDFYLDGIRVYNPAGTTDLELGETIVKAYIADNEYNPNYSEMKTNLVDIGDLTANGQATGVTFIDGRSELNTGDAAQLATSMDVFKNCGPNNEIYLSYGQGIGFYIYSQYKPTGIQIGLKSINNNNVTATCKFWLFHINDFSINSSSTRFYDISEFIAFDGSRNPVDFAYDEATGMYKSTSAIIISNTLDNGGILSVTNIKLTYPDSAGIMTVDALEETQYSLAGHVKANAKISAYLGSTMDVVTDGYSVVRQQYLENKNEFNPNFISAKWDRNCTAPGETVTLTISTSTDVEIVRVNGVDASVIYYNAYGDVKASAKGAKKAVWTVTLDVETAGEYLAQIEAVAQDGKIHQTTATIYSVEY